MISLFLQMGDSDMTGLSSDSSRSEGSSSRASTIDWGYESDEATPEVIFFNPMESGDEMSLMGQEDMDMVGDTESVIGDLSIFETPNATVNDEVESQENMFLGGIWWDSCWAQN